MGHKPSITVDSPDIRAAQKRMALMTIVVPFAGTLAAAMLALKYGVGVMEISLLLSLISLPPLASKSDSTDSSRTGPLKPRPS